MEGGADVNIGCEVNQTAMMAAAAFYGHFDIVKYLHLHQGQTSASPTMLVILDRIPGANYRPCHGGVEAGAVSVP